MKIENLKRAQELREELRKIDVNIETVELANYVKIGGGNTFECITQKLKYEGDTILNVVRPLFLSALQRAKQDLLDEVESLD